MNNILTNNLKFSKSDNLWIIHGAGGIDYSDGVLVERYLASVVKHARDCSVDSMELNSKIIDWPSEYHLSQKRSNLLKGFTYHKVSTILEIGCGCGAITRYLAENFPQASITSVEGALNRAKIARLRTRGFDNVTIVAAPFQALEFKVKFDIIFCIGVFEYAQLYNDCEKPFDAMLRTLKSLLTEQGVLVIGIENQLGLKYFAGVPEDHTNKRFEGINNYLTTQGRRGRTFSKERLEALLNDNGFKSTTFYYPFPDYKIPSLILSDNAMILSDNRQMVRMVIDHCIREDQATHKRIFDEKSLWREIVDSGLAAQLANSFLVIASANAACDIVTARWCAVIFSGKRRKQYAVKTFFYENKIVEKVSDSLAYAPSGEFTHALPATTSWSDGIALDTKIKELLCGRAVAIESFIEALQPWVRYLKAHSNGAQHMLEGNYIDAVPWNLFAVDEKIDFIDREWIYNQPVSINYVVTRGLYHLFHRAHYYGNNLKNREFVTIKQLIVYLGSTLLEEYNEKDIEEFIERESTLLSTIAPMTRSHAKWNIIIRLSIAPPIAYAYLYRLKEFFVRLSMRCTYLTKG